MKQEQYDFFGKELQQEVYKAENEFKDKLCYSNNDLYNAVGNTAIIRKHEAYVKGINQTLEAVAKMGSFRLYQVKTGVILDETYKPVFKDIGAKIFRLHG
jgi:hypothetical protein